MCVFCFKQKTAYEMRISDWSSDVCSSDLVTGRSVEDLDHVGQIKYFWTHPADTHGMVEFARLKPEYTIDPRAQPFWSSAYWRDEHPLGLTGQIGRASCRERVCQYV